MRNSFSNVLLLFALCSCVTNKVQEEITSFSLVLGGYENIRKECKAIQETGDIFSLLWEIKKDTRLVLQTLERRHYKGMEITIGELAENINQNSVRVIELTKSEWNYPDVRQSIKWHLSDSDFGFRKPYVSDPVVKSVYFLGKEESGLIDRVRVKQEGNDFTIEYLNVATLLEFCQLNETLMIVLEVDVYGFAGVRKKFFNLNVSLEKML